MTPRTITIKKEDFRLLYSQQLNLKNNEVINKLGSIADVFRKFLENEAIISPISDKKLINYFEKCINPNEEVESIKNTLLEIAPGNGKVGFRQVNFLTNYVRNKTLSHIHKNNNNLKLLLHDHAFGSGGDLIKTIHATTMASIIVSPLIRICKTGTGNVTSLHGSYQAIKAFGYNEKGIDIKAINESLEKYNFAYITLSELGFPYSNNLKQARIELWEENLKTLEYNYQNQQNNWHSTVRNLDLPISIDIFKIIAPNAQLLNPVNHTTGISHIGMLPYVIGIYLELGSTGIIVHSYEGIDEISNAYRDVQEERPNNLLIKIDLDSIKILEFSPEDISLKRVPINQIEEQKEIETERDLFYRILTNENTYEIQGKRDFILANAASILVANNAFLLKEKDLIEQIQECISKVNYLINSGKSYDNFRRMINISKIELDS
ncbi:hypothetical protein [Okeania sp.]|uniref:hypothetical protein n=1 Tax=Okeania sp. TaxID=3100323 RepID=UPI002B4B53E0|nr:hypothetical protein [Okeania sp.]MEB3342431.1 hypothetical protein [Okeania sp.]